MALDRLSPFRVLTVNAGSTSVKVVWLGPALAHPPLTAYGPGTAP